MPAQQPREEWKANSSPIALLTRTAATLWTARKVHKNVAKLKKELAGRPSIDDEERRRLWEDLHRRNARLAYRHISKYRGFLTKIGQATSTKAGAVPQPWVEELGKLQDQLPESPVVEVRKTIIGDLGAAADDLLRDFVEKPIASASVAQAHVARLRTTGEKVCVKVQHRGVAKVMGVDLAAVEYIGRKAAQWYPEAPDISDLAKEWRRASREEVDFNLERDNMITASRGLSKAGVDVACPVPVEGYCGKHVLTMSFIDGWKITEVARLPRGFDRTELGRRLVDGFMALTFGEGLIHGDPHPGNVFVTRSGGGEKAGSLGFKPVLLDWGIVQRVSCLERQAMARWAFATLSEDRFMYMAALKDLGFVFGDSFDESALVDWLHMSAWSLRDSIPSNSQMQFKEQMDGLQSDAEGEGSSPESQQASSDRGNAQASLRKVPGTVLFFLRALEMLQQVCGTLDAQVSFSKSILHWAMPLLRPGKPAAALPDKTTCPEMELDVRTKLSELMDAKLVLGAQIAVDADKGGDLSFNLAAGRTRLVGGPLSQASLIPLLDIGRGVLVACFLSALADRTASGRSVGLDTPVVELWPEFARRGKTKITIADLLGHRGGLTRPFHTGLSLRAFCNEARVEESIAASPAEKHASGKQPRTCDVLSEIIAALLKRVQGTESSAKALAASLKALGLDKDIVYNNPDKLERGERFAFLGNRLLESLPLSFAFSWLEEHERDAKRKSRGETTESSEWQSRRELSARVSACFDPLLLNCEDHQSGQSCLAGRGLRATAQALCSLYTQAAKLIPAEIMARSVEDATELGVDSVEEWEDLGRCVNAGLGWQLFRFQRNDGSEVIGYGHTDSATGSIALRLPDVSVAVLLTSIDKNARHVGRDLLSIIVSHFGLVPVWHLTPPMGVPDRAPLHVKAARIEAPQSTETQHVADLNAKIAELEGRVAQLLNGEARGQPEPAGLEGEWRSIEIQGLDSLLGAFEVPAATRVMASRVRRALSLHVEGSDISMTTSTTILGRTLEDTKLQFTIGHEFEGEEGLMGASFRGLASWEELNSSRALVIERRFHMNGHEMVLRERLVEQSPGQLSVETTLVGLGTRVVQLRTEDDRERLIQSLDAAGERLVREAEVGSQQLLRGAFLENVPQDGPGALPVPGNITLRYEDVTCRMTFARARGAADAREHAAARIQEAAVSASAVPTRDQAWQASSSAGHEACASPAPRRIAARALSAVGRASLCLASASLRLTGRACMAGCNACMPRAFRHRQPPDLCQKAGRSEVDSLGDLRGNVLRPSEAMLSRECEVRSLCSDQVSLGAMTPVKFNVHIDTGAGVSPLLDQSDTSLTARSTGTSEHMDRSERTLPTAMDQVSNISASSRDILGSSCSEFDREMALMQLLSQQQTMQQKLMEQMMTQQALIPQQLQAQQEFVSTQLVDVQRRLTEQSLAQRRNELLSMSGTSSRSPATSTSRWERPRRGPPSSCASSAQTPGVCASPGGQQPISELKEALIDALNRGSPPSASSPASRRPQSRDPERLEDALETSSMRSMRSSIETLKRLKERLEASAPGTRGSSSRATPRC